MSYLSLKRIGKEVDLVFAIGLDSPKLFDLFQYLNISYIYKYTTFMIVFYFGELFLPDDIVIYFTIIEKNQYSDGE